MGILLAFLIQVVYEMLNEVVNGDINLDLGSRVLVEENRQSQGVMLDYAVERYAYVRLLAQSGQERFMQLSFVREY